MYKSTLRVARKIPILLMVFFINRVVLFSRDYPFPITFFAVWAYTTQCTHPSPFYNVCYFNYRHWTYNFV